MSINTESLRLVDPLQRQSGTEPWGEWAMVIHQRPVWAEDENAVVIQALGAIPAAAGQLYTDDLSALRVQCPALEHEPKPGTDAQLIEVVLDQLVHRARVSLAER